MLMSTLLQFATLERKSGGLIVCGWDSGLLSRLHVHV